MSSKQIDSRTNPHPLRITIVTPTPSSHASQPPTQTPSFLDAPPHSHAPSSRHVIGPYTPMFTHALTLSYLIISKQHLQLRSHSSLFKSHLLHTNSSSHTHTSVALSTRSEVPSNSRVRFALVSQRVLSTSRFRSFHIALHTLSLIHFTFFIFVSNTHHLALLFACSTASQHTATLQFPTHLLQTRPPSADSSLSTSIPTPSDHTPSSLQYQQYKHLRRVVPLGTWARTSKPHYRTAFNCLQREFMLPF